MISLELIDFNFGNRVSVVFENLLLGYDCSELGFLIRVFMLCVFIEWIMLNIFFVLKYFCYKKGEIFF